MLLDTVNYHRKKQTYSKYKPEYYDSHILHKAPVVLTRKIKKRENNENIYGCYDPSD